MPRASEKLVHRAAVLAAVLTMTALPALPAVSGAAIVRVEEEPPDTGEFGGGVNKAHLIFTTGPGESNGLVIAVAATEGDFLKLQLLDTGATVEAGAKCSGGGAPGVPVTCVIHEPKAPDLQIVGGKVIQPIPKTGWDDDFAIDLGDGTDSFDASGIGGGLSSDQVAMRVTGGAGDDTILTGGGRDTIDPGAGADTVRAGGGHDLVYATEAPDGPDFYDLGPGVGKVDYAKRQEPVLFDGQQGGASGESDLLLGESLYLTGGAANDTFVGGPGLDRFDGNGGGDTLLGGAGADQLLGGIGADELRGGDGADLIGGGPDDDLLDGGRDADRLIDLATPFEPGTYANVPRPPGASGDDTALGRGGDDTISLEGGVDRADGGGDNDRIGGGAGADRLGGAGGSDVVVGQGGRDRLEGGPGPDRLFGGRTPSGGTFFYFEATDDGPDSVGCGAGRDVASANPWDTTRKCEVVHRVRPK